MKQEKSGADTFDILKMSHQIENRQKRRRTLQGAAVAGLFLLGAKLRGPSGALAFFLGASLAIGTLGRAALKRLHAHSTRRADGVDEASAESFPASDPPALPIQTA